jgi:hypothetical protein
MVLQKSSLIFGGLGVAGFLLLVFLLLSQLPFRNTTEKSVDPANSTALAATYVGTRLQQIDRAHATLFFSYDLENKTAMDYHLVDGPDVFVMARLKRDGSLSQEEALKLSHPVVALAGQRIRITIEEQYPFAWPSAFDPGLDDKLKNFVRQKLGNLAGLVLFDEVDDWQVELPGGWFSMAKN